MLKGFDPSIKGRGFFKRTEKEILTLKVNRRSKGIKRCTFRMKKLDEFKKTTETRLVRKTEKLKKIKAELESIK